MTRRALLNVGLFIVVVALTLVVYFQPGVEHKPEPAKLTGLKPSDVARIFIRQSGGAEFSLSRTNGRWMIESPIHTYGNEFRIEPLLGVTEAESYASFETQGQDLKQYRLDPPLALLRLNDTELMFGGTEPINNRRYVEVGGRVHLVDDYYYSRLQADLSAFVSNQLLPPGAKPTNIRLPGLALARDAEGRWTATPAKDASPDAINNLVDEWKNAQAIEVDRNEGSDAGEPIRIEFETGMSPIELRIVAKEPDVIFAREDLGLRYHVTADQARRLLSLQPASPADKPGS